MRSISELSSEANAYDFSPHVSFSSWIHACRTLLREANVYYAEGADLERAYVLYLRYADIVLNKLRKHPQFGQNKPLYNKAALQVPVAIDHSETLKKRLLERPPPASKPVAGHVPSQGRSHARASALNDSHAADAFELELEKYANDTADVPEFDLDSLNLKEQATAPVASKPRARKVPEYERFLPSTASPPGSRQSSAEPVDQFRRGSQSVETPPTKPGAQAFPDIKSIHYTEKGSPLRTVFVPSQLRFEFLNYAASNTRSNLETCGILCGKLRHNAFFVTDLVIPHQTSTSDSCTTTNEEELFEYVDKRDLFIVGWIHTHPTQTCFMSSVDLHTQAGYQLMLPEAVAIVCAPNSSPDWGAFRLTDPPGVDVIKTCRLSGFHQHEPNDNLYKRAKPGHYREIEFNLVSQDLRDR